jgi:xanthine/uracil/vitamin C permease (AzgA family)
MSIDMPAALATEPAETVVEVPSATSEWAETALTVLFTAVAVLFVSFLAVVTGIV